MTDDHEPNESRAACEEVLAELYSYLDGELTDAKRVSIGEHLDECSPCLEAFDFEAELRIVIRSRCRDEVPEALRRRIADSLSELDRDLGIGPSSLGADA